MKSLPTDERQTPRWFFRVCNGAFGPFDLDACAAAWNAQLLRYVTKEQDIFAHHPRSRCTWRNPPYSRGNLNRHLEHARAVTLAGGSKRYVCLVPADPSTDWWRKHVMRPEGRPLRADWLWQQLPEPLGNATRYVSQGLITTVVLVDGRLPFAGPDGPVGGTPGDRRETGAMQPSALIVFEIPDVRKTRAA